MNLKVTKRNGKIVDFNKNKIKMAVLKAFFETDGEETIFAREKAREISNYIESLNKDMNVEEIQDIIVNKLMASSRKDVATKYVEYRYLHHMARDQYQNLIDAISEKLSASNVQNQNANVDEHSFGGRMGEARNELMKDYALNYIVSPMAKENHINNMVYIHDLDSYAVGMHNCLTIPFDDLLAKGFNTRQTDVRPARSINTAFQLVAVLFQLQSLQQFGGVSASHIDWTMVPYVRMSFYKHYLEGLEFIWDEDILGSREPERCFIRYFRENEIKPEDISIESNIYKTANMQSPYRCIKGVYDYALKMTEKELNQAVEGMYHNLNY